MRWAENEPVLDGGNLPRPFRHLRVAEHRTPDLSSSQVPVHSVLVQKSVTTAPTPQVGFQDWMLGKPVKFRKPPLVKSWQRACKHPFDPSLPLCLLCGSPLRALRLKILIPKSRPTNTRRCAKKKKPPTSGSFVLKKQNLYLAFTMACSSSNTSSSALANRCARCTIADDPTWLFRFSK